MALEETSAISQAQDSIPHFPLPDTSPSAGPAGVSAVLVPAVVVVLVPAMVAVPALPSLLPVPGQQRGEPGGDSGDARLQLTLVQGGNVWHLPSSKAAAGGVEPINPPTTRHESVAGGGGDESGAVEGTRRQRDADTPGGLVSDSGPHPGEDKEPEQEFDCRLVSHQGIVMPVSSGMCTAHGKLPARSPEAHGTPHLPARGGGGQLPHTSLSPQDAPRWLLHPRSLPTSSFPNTFPLSPAPDRQLPPVAVILLVFLMCLCPEGAGDLPVLPFPMRLVRKRSPVIAALSAVTNQLPGEHPAAGARPSPSA